MAVLADLLAEIGYRPRTLALELRGPDLLRSLSVDAHAFLFEALEIDDEQKGITYGQMYGRGWAKEPKLLSRFERLSSAARTEVLAFVTFYVHELTHHIDHIATPFGANLHVKTIREYWSMQDFAPKLLEHPELIPPRLVDFDDHIRSRVIPDEMRQSWEALRGQVFTFEAWGDAATVEPHRLRITKGWPGSTEPVHLFGAAFERIMVHGFFATLAVPDQMGWYLRPLSLLESRAVAHSLLWCLHLLGEAGRGSVHDYFTSLYPRDSREPDYFFLLDALSRAFGLDRFETVLDRGTSLQLSQVLKLTSATAWYALQAPPPLSPESALLSSPAARLLLVLKFVEEAMSAGQTFRSFVDLANQLDATAHARQLGFRGIAEVLDYSVRVVHEVRHLNEERTWNPNVRVHFDHVLDLVEAELHRRNDYTSLVGMPENGNPIFGVDAAADQRLIDEYTPHKDVRDWFNFRQNFFFRFLPKSRVIEALERHYATDVAVVNCACGVVLTGVLSRYQDERKVRCPRCGAQLAFDRESAWQIRVSADGADA